MIRDPEYAVWMQNATPTHSDIEDAYPDLPTHHTDTLRRLASYASVAIPGTA